MRVLVNRCFKIQLKPHILYRFRFDHEALVSCAISVRLSLCLGKAERSYFIGSYNQNTVKTGRGLVLLHQSNIQAASDCEITVFYRGIKFVFKMHWIFYRQI